MKHPFRLSHFSDGANELFKTISDNVELPKELVKDKDEEAIKESDIMELAKRLAAAGGVQGTLEKTAQKQIDDEQKAHATA